MIMYSDYVVRYLIVDRRSDQVITKEKSFKSEAARTRWVDRNIDDIVSVLAVSDPQ